MRSAKYIQSGFLKIITGNPLVLPEPAFGLDPGMKVSRIGVPGKNGKPTSGSRFDDWTPYVIYAGVHEYDGFRLACFLLPEDGVIYAGKPFQGAAFVAYIIAGDELYSTRPDGYIRIHRPGFTLYGDLNSIQ